MDAKRIIPVLRVCAGQVTGPDAGPDAGPGPASERALRLEQEGADGILFQETGPALPGTRAPWIREVAGLLSIPFALEAPFQDGADLEEALAAGVDKVVLTPATAEDPLLAAAVRAFGRVHVAVAVTALLTAESGWQAGPQGGDALDWMAELERQGCGEILLRAEPEGPASAALVQKAAQLSLSVLVRCGGEASAAEALLQGADAVACPDPLRSPRQWKKALAVHGLTFRD